MGRPVNPLAAGAQGRQGVVLIFTRTDCPISNRYAPEVRRLFEKFSAQGIGFWLVYPNPEVTPAQIRQHLHDYSYPLAALRDPDHQLVRLGQAKITPEVAVFTPEGRLAYHGRIDNRYVDFGRTRPQATEHDLDDVLTDLVRHQPVTRHPQPAVGCYIDDLR